MTPPPGCAPEPQRYSRSSGVLNWAHPATGRRKSVQQDGNFGKAAYAFSGEGTLVYFPGVDTTARNTPRSLVWVDREGNEDVLDVEPDAYYYPRLSGDGRLAIAIFDRQGTDLWIHDLNRVGLNRLTFDGANTPVWSNDGSRIYYDRTGTDAGLYWQASDGSGEPQQLTTTNNLQRPAFLSVDGGELIYDQLTDSWDLYALPIAGGTERPVLDEPYNELLGQVSPDGRHILYYAEPEGLGEIYIRRYPSLSGRWQVSQGGAYEAKWGPAGDEIFYRRGNELWVASIEVEDTSDGVQLIESRRLFSTEAYFRPIPDRPTFDVAADGQRFLMIKPEDEGVDSRSGQSSLVVVENWFEELSRLAPPAEPFE